MRNTARKGVEHHERHKSPTRATHNTTNDREMTERKKKERTHRGTVENGPLTSDGGYPPAHTL